MNKISLAAHDHRIDFIVYTAPFDGEICTELDRSQIFGARMNRIRQFGSLRTDHVFD